METGTIDLMEGLTIEQQFEENRKQIYKHIEKRCDALDFHSNVRLRHIYYETENYFIKANVLQNGIKVTLIATGLLKVLQFADNLIKKQQQEMRNKFKPKN